MTPYLLVAEDDLISREILMENLGEAGYAVDVAENGDAAWALLTANPERYCAVLLDRMMPGIDGIEVLRRVKADEALTHIPVVMQSGLVRPEEVLEGLRGGAYYYLTKPFPPKPCWPSSPPRCAITDMRCICARKPARPRAR